MKASIFCANPLYQNSGSDRDTGARQTSWTVAIISCRHDLLAKRGGLRDSGLGKLQARFAVVSKLLMALPLVETYEVSDQESAS